EARRAHTRAAAHPLDSAEARRDLRRRRGRLYAPRVDAERASLGPRACVRRPVTLGRKLVILHIDGLGADMLERSLAGGRMPNLRRLIDTEGYVIHRYRCGLPSTTPFAQAGILYGDNSEIPCFRWWDR